MEPAQIQALAIISLCAFVGVLVMAVSYAVTVRPRLLAPEEFPEWAGGPPESGWREEWAGQRAAIQQLSAALDDHSQRLSAAAVSAAPEAYDSLQDVLGEQADAVRALERLIGQQTARLDGLDQRVGRQGEQLERLASVLDRPAAAPDLTPLHDLIQSQAARLDAVLDRPAAAPDLAPLHDLIQAQADRLEMIGARVDEWSAYRTQSDAQLAEHARILAGLDRELAAQARAVQQIDSRVSEHTSLLVTAASERRAQMGAIERLVATVAQIVPLVGQAIHLPVSRPAADQDRLTEIKGIGPVYASRFYEAGVKTFRQLSTMTVDEVHTLLGLPEWRKKSVSAASWIEQAEHLASLSEKVEQQP